MAAVVQINGLWVAGGEGVRGNVASLRAKRVLLGEHGKFAPEGVDAAAGAAARAVSTLSDHACDGGAGSR